MALLVNVAHAQPIPLPPERVETITQFPPVGTPENLKPRPYTVTKPAQLPQRGHALPRISVPDVPPTTSDLPILDLEPERKESPMRLTEPDRLLPKTPKTPKEKDVPEFEDGPLSVTNKELPATREDIFNVENDTELLRRIRNELAKEEYNRQTPKEKENDTPELKADEFIPPNESIASDKLTYVAKTFSYPPRTQVIYPAYVTHRPLYFEDKNSERYGWELGIAQPAISALIFYKDALFWPAHLASNIHERYDTNRGKCLPGSPVPYYLYPPQISLLGLGAEASAVALTAAFIVP